MKAGLLETMGMIQPNGIFNILLKENILDFIFWSESYDGGGSSRCTFVRTKAPNPSEETRRHLLRLNFKEKIEDGYATFWKKENGKNSIEIVETIFKMSRIEIHHLNVSSAENEDEVLKCVSSADF